MASADKNIIKILSGNSDSNIPFADLCNILNRFNFQKRIKGDHNIFFRDDIDEIINLQPIGNKAKAYQVKQVRSIIIKYKLGGDLDV